MTEKLANFHLSFGTTITSLFGIVTIHFRFFTMGDNTELRQTTQTNLCTANAVFAALVMSAKMPLPLDVVLALNHIPTVPLHSFCLPLVHILS